MFRPSIETTARPAAPDSRRETSAGHELHSRPFYTTSPAPVADAIRSGRPKVGNPHERATSLDRLRGGRTEREIARSPAIEISLNALIHRQKSNWRISSAKRDSLRGG
jgi:hypothetical protein